MLLKAGELNVIGVPGVRGAVLVIVSGALADCEAKGVSSKGKNKDEVKLTLYADVAAFDDPANNGKNLRGIQREVERLGDDRSLIEHV